MKTVAFGMFLAFVLTGTAAFAQMGTGQGMDKGRMMMKYDPSTEVTVKGTVEEVQGGSNPMSQGGMMGSKKGMGRMGTHLVLKTQDGTLTVIVGPSRFIADKGFSFAKDDQIEVTGSKLKYQGKDEILAREIKKGDKLVVS
jgi:DNA/RNA endonuclease YhcR with UshA esterase domain